jgi:hypothetical protein
MLNDHTINISAAERCIIIHTLKFLIGDMPTTKRNNIKIQHGLLNANVKNYFYMEYIVFLVFPFLTFAGFLRRTKGRYRLFRTKPPDRFSTGKFQAEDIDFFLYFVVRKCEGGEIFGAIFLRGVPLYRQRKREPGH